MEKDRFVLSDAARMLRAAARLLDKAADMHATEGQSGAWVRQAHTNIDAAVARMPTVAETKG